MVDIYLKVQLEMVTNHKILVLIVRVKSLVMSHSKFSFKFISVGIGKLMPRISSQLLLGFY